MPARHWAVSLVVFHSPVGALLRTVASALDQQPAPGQVLVHVNDDADGRTAADLEAELVRRWPQAPFVVTTSAANHGFAGAHDALLSAAFAAGAGAVLVLNPDVVVSPGCVAELAAVAGTSALTGPLLQLADPVTLQPEGLVDSAGIRWTWTGRHLDAGQGDPVGVVPTQPYAVRGLTGACLWVPREVHDTVVAATGEFFDEDFLAYREDAELGLRATRLGIAQLVVPTATALHGRSLRGTSRGNPALDRLGVQNRFLIAFKHGRRRPGAWFGAPLRDMVVVAGVLARERHSLPGLRNAWRLRPAMRAKGARIRSAERSAR
jgi:GT2 family glycosyltransferase